MGVEFKPVSLPERELLEKALRRNAEEGAPLRMDALTTGWVPDDGLLTDETVVDAIKSVPCHY